MKNKNTYNVLQGNGIPDKWTFVTTTAEAAIYKDGEDLIYLYPAITDEHGAYLSRNYKRLKPQIK